MTWRTATRVFIVSTLAVIAAWDIVAVKFGGGRATISEFFLDATCAYSWGRLILIAWGVLIGHLFVPQKEK